MYLAPLVALAVAYRGNLGFQLVGDAEFLIRDNATLRAWSSLPAQLSHDYFWASSGEAIGYWRPFTKLSWLVETLLGRGAPWVYHGVQLAWFASAVVAVAALLRGAGAGRLPSLLGASVVALHPAAVEPVSLVMARSDVVAFSASLWSLCGLQRYLHEGRARWLLVQAALLSVALLSKEVAVASLAPLAALLWSSTPRGERLRRAWVLAPSLGVLALYLGARALVLTGVPAPALETAPVRLFVGAAAYARALFPFQLETGLRHLANVEVVAPGTLALAALSLTAAAALLVPTLRRRQPLGLAALVWAAGGLGLTLLIADPRVPDAAGKLVLADRWALPGVGAVGLLLGTELAARSGRRWSLAAAAAVTCWGAASLLVSSLQRSPYADGIALLALEDRALEATPPRFRLPTDLCRAQERAVVRAVAARDADAVLAAATTAKTLGCPTSETLAFNVLSALVTTRRYAEATPWLAWLEAHPPAGRARAQYHHLAGLTYLEAGGQPSLARAHFQAALDGGLRDCSLFQGLAASSLDEPARASSALEEAWRCEQARGAARPELLGLAAELAERAGDAARARSLRERLAQLPSPP